MEKVMHKVIVLYLLIMPQSALAGTGIQSTPGSDEYDERKAIAMELYDSLSVQQKRELQSKIHVYGQLMMDLQNLMSQMNESERIIVIEKYKDTLEINQ